MKKKRKICVVIINRANYARIKSALRAIKNHSNLKLQLVVGSSALLDRFGDVSKIIEKDGFKIDAKTYLIVEGENPITMAKSVGLGIIELSSIFQNLRPDFILTIADRFETMATAICASYMNIPLAHTQGGEITGSLDESVRHAITKLAHIHFTTNQLTAQRIIRMGEDPSRVFITGCPSMDLINELDLNIKKDFIKKYGGVGGVFNFNKPYLVVMQHPVTTEYEQGLNQINETLKAISILKIPTVWFWPNIDAGSDNISEGLRRFRENQDSSFIHFFKNISPEDYIRLIYNSKCVVGNSSSGIRECSFLGIPSVNIGTRQQGRQKGENVIDCDYKASEIIASIKKQIQHGPYPRSNIYGDGKAGIKIADLLSKISVKIQKRITY